MAKNWIQGAVKKPGQLHKDLGVPQGKDIPTATLTTAAQKPGKVGERARFAETMKKIRTRNVGAPVERQKIGKER